jgi:hypothetical protein
MRRDSTVVRALYNANISALNRWKAGFEKMQAGDEEALSQMPGLTKAMEDAHRAFSEESRHFVKWGRKVVSGPWVGDRHKQDPVDE